MNLRIFQVDAFTDQVFKGNPAAVCPLDSWLDASVMQNIAAENNLAETAFFVKNEDNDYGIRWFTPITEVELCGHATLASAHVLFQEMNYPEERIKFSSLSGDLAVSKVQDNMLELDFPADSLQKLSNIPGELINAFGIEIEELFEGRSDLMAVVGSEEIVRQLQPDFIQLSKINARGIIVTAPGKESDFVSRFFAPSVGVNEDPVTGSAHTTLTPYWSGRLGKSQLKAFQLSERGGKLICKKDNNRVRIAGHCVTYLKGEIFI